MATLKQIVANRENARHSTGPVTAAGKASVRFNALKSGIDAASQLIPGEDPLQLQAFIAGFYQSWQPVGLQECDLVDQLIDDAWRLRRLRAADTQLWMDSFHYVRSCRARTPETEVGIAFSSASERLSRLQRVVSAVRRSYHQTLVDLQRLQAARAQVDAAALPEDEPPAAPPPETEVAEQSQSDPPPVPLPAPPASDPPPLLPGSFPSPAEKLSIQWQEFDPARPPDC